MQCAPRAGRAALNLLIQQQNFFKNPNPRIFNNKDSA